jgi:hypothetical protein
MLLQQATTAQDMTPSLRQECLLWLARAQHAAGQTAAAAETYRTSLMLGRPSLLPFSEMPLYRPPLAAMLAGLDATLDNAASFRTFCDALLATHPDLHDAIFRYWALSPATPSPDVPHCVRAESFTAHDLLAAWQWCDPRDRGTVTSGADLEIHAAEGCDLWHLNFAAPRLLTTLDGDFAIQATCAPVTCGMPMGGLCLWGDTGNFLRLDRGALGPGEVSLMGCIAGQDCMVGRGRLPGSTVTLRLERRGVHVRGLCSVDSQIWWLVGECEWPWQGCVAVGPFVVGLIDRTLYPAAPPHGGGLQFSTVQIWRV